MAITTISTLYYGLCFFQKIGKMLKTSMSDYEKSSMVTYPFYFINRQSIHKTNCMQRIKKILMREVFPAIALNQDSAKEWDRGFPWEGGGLSCNS